MVITNPGGMYDGSEVQLLDLRHVPSKLMYREGNAKNRVLKKRRIQMAIARKVAAKVVNL